jgi:hypothetical protein
MPKSISCREFLERKQNQKRYQNCLVRIFDRDDYEHITFRLREDTNFDNFNNVFDQELFDSCVSEYFIFNDENGITICLNGDIEL